MNIFRYPWNYYSEFLTDQNKIWAYFKKCSRPFLAQLQTHFPFAPRSALILSNLKTIFRSMEINKNFTCLKKVCRAFKPSDMMTSVDLRWLIVDAGLLHKVTSLLISNLSELLGQKCRDLLEQKEQGLTLWRLINFRNLASD